ncbi:MAG: YaaC family protein [Candidatus Helarchaeota archaeon]
MTDDLKERIENCEEKINNNTFRIEFLERKDIKVESYKLFLYPQTILNYISNIIDLQTNKGKPYFYYPTNYKHIFNFLGNKFNLKNIKYNIKIKDKELFEICQIISYQGLSGFNYLENLENNIDLNKPLTLYYGIMHLGVFFSNLHFNFTPFNHSISKSSKFKTHGISHYEINNIDTNIEINDILSKKIQLKKMGVAPRFFLTYKSFLLKYFLKEIRINLLDLLKNYFLQAEESIKIQFIKNFGHDNPTHYFNSKMLSIYLLSYYFSMLSRYKIHAWTKLLQDKSTNISYFIKFFLKFAKNEFIDILFNTLERRIRKDVSDMLRWLL